MYVLYVIQTCIFPTTVTDPNSGLLAFLTRFDSLEFNSFPTSHCHRFGPPYTNFLRFFVLAKGLPPLEGLLKVHGDFISGFRGGVFLGDILMELLCAVLVSLKDTPLDSLSKERRLEWRGWCKILCRQSSAFPSCWSTFGQ